MIGRIKALGKRIAEKAASARVKALAGVTTAVATLGQTGDISDALNSMLPLIMSLFALLIPIIFLMKIFDMFERLFRSFS